METMQNFKNEGLLKQFKSYYVVWKQSEVLYRKILWQSLNRTMQYGNVYISRRKNETSFCLNRTMQYGNAGVAKKFEAEGEEV